MCYYRLIIGLYSIKLINLPGSDIMIMTNTEKGDLMKDLYIIGGTMGVGKTTVSERLLRLLPDCVFLDGDWCWKADPFAVTDETKAMVTDNICHMLNNFIRCSAYSNIVFCWVMHQQSIIDSILSRLDASGCRVHCISLIADKASLTRRLEKDISAGIRDISIIARSVDRLPLYDTLDTLKIDVSGITPDEAASIIAAL